MKAINITQRILLFICVMFIFTGAYSVEKPTTTAMKAFAPPPIATITGIVKTKMDPKGAVSDIALTTAEGKIFKVVVNDNGAKLGKELNGKTAEVTAELAILTFKKFTATGKPSPPSVNATKETTEGKLDIEELEKTAKEIKAAENVVWTGIVAVAKDEKGKINAISFATDDKKVWQVTVDETSTKMANELDGQKAGITFALNIKTFKAVEMENLENEIKTEIKTIEKAPKDK